MSSYEFRGVQPNQLHKSRFEALGKTHRPVFVIIQVLPTQTNHYFCKEIPESYHLLPLNLPLQFFDLPKNMVM